MQNVSLLPTSPSVSPIRYPSPVSESSNGTSPLSVSTTLYETDETAIDLQFANLAEFETWAVESGIASSAPSSPYWEAIAPAADPRPTLPHWVKLTPAELAILHRLQGRDPGTPFFPQPTEQPIGYPHLESIHLWSQERRPDPLPAKPNSVTEVGTRWTLPLTVAALRLPFLDATYCSLSIVSLALLSRPLSSSGLLFFPCYCSHITIVLTVLIVLPFW
jgi:hypothetical protein